MNRNVILAFLISTAVIIAYYLIFPPPERQTKVVEQQSVTQEKKTSTTEAQKTATKKEGQSTGAQNTDTKVEESEKQIINKEEKITKIQGDLYQAKISSVGGSLQSFVLNEHYFSSKPRINILNTIWNAILGRSIPKRSYDPNRKIDMVFNNWQQKLPAWAFSLHPQETLFFETNKENILLTKEESLLLQTTSQEGILVEKKISFDPQKYLVKIDITIFNPTNKAVRIQPSFSIGAGAEPNESYYQARPTRAVVYADNDLDIYNGNKLKTKKEFKNFDWVGVMDIYFIQVIKKREGWLAELSAEKGIFNYKEVELPFLELKSEKNSLLANERWQNSFEIFIGPKEKSQMIFFSKNLEKTLDITIDFLGPAYVDSLALVLPVRAELGVAIILLTLLVRIILFPLTYKGMKSMRRNVFARTENSRSREKKHEGNKEKINKEMMEVYRKYKVNPVGGCLPLLLQIPIFIALYSALIPAIELRQSSFIFWIIDLSQADFLYVLPILMGFSMYLQQKLAPTSATMDATQQKILKWLPVIMTFFFLNFPASLVLYWLTSNIISIGQQKFINSRMDGTELQEVKTTKTSHAERVKVLKKQMEEQKKKNKKKKEKKMKISILAKKIELTPALKKHIHNRFARLEKFNKNFNLEIHLSTIKNKSVVHLILTGDKETYRATEDRYKNIHKAIIKAYNKIKKPIRRNRKGVISRFIRKFKLRNQ